MHPYDEEKMAFITPMANYHYKVMPFGLKNARTTYQRLMSKVFMNHIRNLMEIYIDNMLVKIMKDGNLLFDLEIVFSYLCKHNTRLNPQKCAFTIDMIDF